MVLQLTPSFTQRVRFPTGERCMSCCHIDRVSHVFSPIPSRPHGNTYNLGDQATGDAGIRTRETPQAGGPHGDDNSKIPTAVCVEEHEHRSPAADGEAVPGREGRRPVGAEARYGGL